MGELGEWIDRGLIAAFLLACILMGVVFSAWGRRIARDPRANAKARGRLRQRLWKAGVLNGQVSGEEELELLANWQREMGRLQVSARPVLFVGALAGGLAAGALLVVGVSFNWAIWPIGMVALAAILGCLAAGEARRSRGEIVQTHPGVSTIEAALRISNYRPTLALITGCAAVALSFMVSLLLLTRALPTETKYGHAGDASVLLRMPEWLLVTPTSALALLLLAELTVRRLLHSPTLSRNPNLQRRAAERWIGWRLASLPYLEASLLPIFVYIQLSDLPLQFMSPYSDVVGIADLLLMLVGVFTGTFALLKNLGEVAPSHT